MRSRTLPFACLLLSHRCTRLLTATALLADTLAFAARVEIDIQGLEGPLADAASANVALGKYEDRDVTLAEVRRLFEAGAAQILAALEPFGYSRARIHGELQQKTTSSAEACVSTDTGPGVRLGVERRRINRHGHQLGGEITYSTTGCQRHTAA
jgi:hypothetical protein